MRSHQIGQGFLDLFNVQRIFVVTRVKTLERIREAPATDTVHVALAMRRKTSMEVVWNDFASDNLAVERKH